jgi:hypothetical protein
MHAERWRARRDATLALALPRSTWPAASSLSPALGNAFSVARRRWRTPEPAADVVECSRSLEVLAIAWARQRNQSDTNPSL